MVFLNPTKIGCGNFHSFILCIPLDFLTLKFLCHKIRKFYKIQIVDVWKSAYTPHVPIEFMLERADFFRLLNFLTLSTAWVFNSFFFFSSVSFFVLSILIHYRFASLSLSVSIFVCTWVYNFHSIAIEI